jgi:NADH:ubiquinone oxidoreductase subunit 6 (subunit J)
MMLEVRTFNVAQRFQDLFSHRSWILILFALEFFLFVTQGIFDIYPLLSLFEDDNWSLFFRESNLSVNYATLLQRTDHLRGLGGILFTEYKFAIILAAILLLLSMIGAIVITLDNVSFNTIKVQNPNVQSLRQPMLLGNSYRKFSIRN